ncbi:MAG: carboxypeptidase regulatory-like domain-containing protein, partial [Thermoplasmata archaeon]|nr:carboxypeptidase regulatory-like domain-containing protein [Thermoplasmata archaeon]
MVGSGSKKLKCIIYTFVIIYFIIGSWTYGYYRDNNTIDDTEIDEQRQFILSGVVRNYTTHAPLNDVNIKFQVEWISLTYARVQINYEDKTNPPSPYITQTLEEMNTYDDGKYHFEVPVLKPSGTKRFYYLRFSKPSHFNESLRFCDTGEEFMAFNSTVLLSPFTKLTGKVTSANGDPLDNAMVIAIPTGSNIVPYPELEYLTISDNGNFEFNKLNPNTNYDLVFGCYGYETRIVKNETLVGRYNNTVYTSLMPTSEFIETINVTGSILINEICTKYYLNEMDFFVWGFKDQGHKIYIINIDSEGRFSIKLPEGY